MEKDQLTFKQIEKELKKSLKKTIDLDDYNNKNEYDQIVNSILTSRNNNRLVSLKIIKFIENLSSVKVRHLHKHKLSG